MVKVLEAGSQILALAPPLSSRFGMQPHPAGHMSTVPSGWSIRWTGACGQVAGGVHCPTADGGSCPLARDGKRNSRPSHAA